MVKTTYNIDKSTTSSRDLKSPWRMENDRVYIFLVGLNRDVDEVKGRILDRRPLPSL
ncbi:hypothetical protein AAG906_007864 [Vitis piasezkii]